ncbi:MAG: hypothetical protein ACR2GW_10390 [Pyrinomonadaceae bacterium]
MKTLAFWSFMLSAAVALNAQTTGIPKPPGVEVLKFSWNKERLGWERDPFNGTNENFHEMRVRARNEKRISDAKGNNPAEVNKLERDARADEAIIESKRRKGPPRYAFLYKVSVKNTSAKAIKEIDWDYVFFDAATGQELGRRQFTHTERISPGKSKELSLLIPAPPTQRISVYSLGKKERDGLDEQIILVRVLYADGTIWQRP